MTRIGLPPNRIEMVAFIANRSAQRPRPVGRVRTVKRESISNHQCVSIDTHSTDGRAFGTPGPTSNIKRCSHTPRYTQKVPTPIFS